MKKRQRGFKQAPKKFFYKEDIFVSRMASILKMPKPKVKTLFYEKPLCSIKLNGIKPSVLEKKGLELKEVEWSKETYLVKNQSSFFVKKMQDYKKGLFFVQNLAEMIPPLSLNPNPNDMVLDMYPTQSSAHFISLMDYKGEIFANLDDRRGEDLDKEYPDYFDKILLVAPSSREGIVTFAQKRPLKNWSIQKTKALSNLQKKLIAVAFNCLKRGGVLAYSTTTISPNENEAVVTELLLKNKNAVLEEIPLIEDKRFSSYKPFIKSALKEWNNENYHPDIVKTIRTIPGKTMIGTYFALIRKT